MGSPLLSLWRVHLILILPIAAACMLIYRPSPDALVLFILFFIPGAFRKFWPLRFSFKVARFRTVVNARVVLHYAPELVHRRNFGVLLQMCETALDDLADQFGFSLRRRLVVYLFPDCRSIGRIFGKQSGGTAFANVIVIADDSSVEESIRHETAHLFCARWMFAAPPILSEGLPTWLQQTHCGIPVDDQARPALYRFRGSLRGLLNPWHFFSDMHRHYVIAGSFTGFLLRHYGWKQYWRLYKRASIRKFDRAFSETYGMALDRAEVLWRNELWTMPALKQRLERELCW